MSKYQLEQLGFVPEPAIKDQWRPPMKLQVVKKQQCPTSLGSHINDKQHS